MAHQRQMHAHILVLCLAVGSMPGCKARAPQAAQVATAGLRIDVSSAKYDKRNQRFDVAIKIWNDHDQRVAFELANVRLLFNGREVAAKRARGREVKPEVLQMSNAEFRWLFELGQDAGPGSYSIEIRDIMKGEMALGETAVFAINN